MNQAKMLMKMMVGRQVRKLLKTRQIEQLLSQVQVQSLNCALKNLSKKTNTLIDVKSIKADDFPRKRERYIDFRERPKYEDCQSYIFQSHHSIGHGLYCTDELEDLPPRHKTKVLNVLKTAAANFNIPVDYMLAQYSMPDNCSNYESKMGNSGEQISRKMQNENLQNKKKTETCGKPSKILYESKSNRSANEYSQNMQEKQHVNNCVDKSYFKKENLLHSLNNSKVLNDSVRSSVARKDIGNKRDANNQGAKVKNFKSEENKSNPVQSDNSKLNYNISNKSLTELAENGSSSVSSDCFTRDNSRSHNRNFSPIVYPKERSGFSGSHENNSRRNFKEFHGKISEISEPVSKSNFVEKSSMKQKHLVADGYVKKVNASDDPEKLCSLNNSKLLNDSFRSSVVRKDIGNKRDVNNQGARVKNFKSEENKSNPVQSDNFKLDYNISNKSLTKSEENRVSGDCFIRDNSRSHNRNFSPIVYPKERSGFSGSRVNYSRRNFKEFHGKTTEISEPVSKANFVEKNSLKQKHLVADGYVKKFSASDDSEKLCSLNNSKVLTKNDSFRSSAVRKDIGNKRDVNNQGARVKNFRSEENKNSPVQSDNFKLDYNISNKSLTELEENHDSFIRDNSRSHNRNFSPIVCPKESSFSGSQKNNPRRRNFKEFHSKASEISEAVSKANFVEESSLKKKYLVVDGYFIKVSVSDDPEKLEYWQRIFKDDLEHNSFDLDLCCQFSYTLILSFFDKNHAGEAKHILRKLKNKLSKLKIPQILTISELKFKLKKPCDCETLITAECVTFVGHFSKRYLTEHEKKIKEVENELKTVKKGSDFEELNLTLKDKLNILKECENVFSIYVQETKSKLTNMKNLSNIRKLRTAFIRECNVFQRCLPIYSKRDMIAKLLRFYSVSVVIAETGSGKSTQIVEYALQSDAAERGIIICTQPRKIAAISISHFVSGQIGSAVGKIVGYDLGIEKKFCNETKIIYTTDYCLLRKCIRNRKLTGISCIIVDEAHERTLYTDLLLGMLKRCVPMRPDLRIVITSATINPSVFQSFFHLSHDAVIKIPGRSYPVTVKWLDDDVPENNYVNACVETAFKIHKEGRKGDILVFLTCASEIEEAINMFKDLCFDDCNIPFLISFHGKSDIQEQMLAFQTIPNYSRKVIFATNAAETSLTIPGVKFVIDSGMVKEMIFNPKKNKSVLTVTYISKSSAEQRKGRAGRTQPGICFRMYSKETFFKMPERALPEILKTNLQKALLKIFEFGLKPGDFDFVESPSKELLEQSLESLEHLGAIQNDVLTDLGRKIVQLPLEPRLAKLVLLGTDTGIGYEAVIIAALLSESGKLFLRSKENMNEADKKKRKFCLEQGDLCTFLDIYKKWLEELPAERYNWCVQNYINSRALKFAAKTVHEIIISLRVELSMEIKKRYDNSAFKLHFESVLFDCFSENLCVFSGHPKLGYFSPYLTESFSIHPSSGLCYLGKEIFDFVIFNSIMETSRNFILDVTPIKEETVKKACQAGKFNLQLDILKCLQIHPKVFGPFGESILIRYILGKGGSKIINLETMIQDCIKTKNFQIDVAVERGLITIYTEKRFHDKIFHFINELIEKGHDEMENEEDVIKMSDGSSYFCLGSGGIISDFIMPGEYKEIIINNVKKCDYETVISSLKKQGIVRTVILSVQNGKSCMSAKFKKVVEAQAALSDLSHSFNVQPKMYYKKAQDKSLPFYKLRATWCRSPCNGTGWVEFVSEEECIIASGLLTRSSFFIGENYINFTPTYHSAKELYMKNLPGSTDENTIRMKLSEILPDYVHVKNIKLLRTNTSKVTETDRLHAQKKILQLFSRFTPSNKLSIDIKYPNANDVYWSALVYFECCEHGEMAYKDLNGKAKFESCSLTLEEVIESDLKCSKNIFFAVEKSIKKIVDDYKKDKICKDLNVTFPNENNVCINFTCTSIEGLNSMRHKLMKLLQGRVINCVANSKYSILFHKSSTKFIKKTEKITRTYILLNRPMKTVSVYGSQESCRNALLEIHSFVSQESSLSKKIFDLNTSCIPSGFLRSLYTKYGFDLSGFIDDFQLKAASFDPETKTLMLEGTSAQLKEAEECLEKICSELYRIKDSIKESLDFKEICAICLEPVSYGFQRLESCGHAFCKQCLLLQLESSSVPFVCVKQNCEKKIFLEDIKRILSSGANHLKKSFCKTAVQYHVNSNLDNIRYCPTPDCQMVYRVSKNAAEFVCPDCENTICTYCQTAYHFGMTCDMFEKCREDEDYSLKVWLRENESKRKHCPSCNVPIEKVSGCNHVECLICKKHLCWLCLEIFSSGSEVYEHLPFCTKNQ